MIKIEKTEVFGWEAAIRGMRNPMNSWDKSDSAFEPCEEYPGFLGENDLKLMKSLSKAGTDHSKFLRMINVTVDITAPLYWWKEFDTYKVGTVANSCSTMHKIHEKPFRRDDFSCEHLIQATTRYDVDCSVEIPHEAPYYPLDVLDLTIVMLNTCRNQYLETHDKEVWYNLIQLLPTSYNQKRTVQLNYQVLKNMYFARRNHKLDEWHTLCDWMQELPYFREICIDMNE